MAELADLIRSIASILWPILLFWSLRTFRDDIARALARIKKAKVLGHEFELDNQLKELHQTANQASNEAAELPRDTLSSPDDNRAPDSDRPQTEDVVQKVIETAARFPTVALLLLATEIEKEGRDVLASIGKWTENRPLPFVRTIERLDSHYGLPHHIPSSLKLFWSIRNRLVHGGSADDRDIASALDSGVTIYRALNSLPREKHWVHHKDVAVYSDQECLHELPGVKGVILRTESSSGATTRYQIFPSTKVYFREGRRVSWEWNLNDTWPDAWYRDPISDAIKPAWSSSGEFVGRHYEDM